MGGGICTAWKYTAFFRFASRLISRRLATDAGNSAHSSTILATSISALAFAHSSQVETGCCSASAIFSNEASGCRRRRAAVSAGDMGSRLLSSLDFARWKRKNTEPTPIKTRTTTKMCLYLILISFFGSSMFPLKHRAAVMSKSHSTHNLKVGETYASQTTTIPKRLTYVVSTRAAKPAQS